MPYNFGLITVPQVEFFGTDAKSTVMQLKKDFFSVLGQLMGDGPVYFPEGDVLPVEHKFDAVGAIRISAFIEDNHRRLDTQIDFLTFMRDSEKSVSQLFG